MYQLRSIVAALAISTGLCQPGNALATTLVVAVHTSDGRSLPGAVVSIRTRGGGDHPGAPVHAVMDQLNKTFVPQLLVLPPGSSVEFRNNDSVSHEIYSFSPAKKFQLPLYHGKPYPPVLFEHTGLVTLGCNIHDWMLAYVLVTDAPYFGQTDKTGSWSVDLPVHTSVLVSVWHPRMGEGAEPEREVTIAESVVSLTLRLTRPLRPAPLESRHSSDTY